MTDTLRVALLNPPWRPNGREGVRAGSRWPYTVDHLGRDATIPFPFFLAYTAALLAGNGLNVALMDGVAERADLDAYLDEVVRREPDLIVYETSTPSFPYDCSLTQRLRGRLAETRVAFAGPHVTVFAEQVLMQHPTVDFVLLGEYEATALELARALAREESCDGILGLALRWGGAVKVNPQRPLIDDLDALPFPARDPAAMGAYHESLCARRPNAQLMSSRGCLFRCPFCLWPKTMYGGPNLRVRSPENVVDEIETLQRDFGFREYYFDDDAINLQPGHVEGICQELQKRGLGIVWSCMGHTGRASASQLEQLRRAGCESIKWGVETGDPDVLAGLRKGTTLDKVREVFAACRSLGIRTHATFTIGLPGETAESIRRTRDFMLELGPDSAQLSITTPFPGTDMWDGGVDLGELDWEQFDGAARAVRAGQGLEPHQLERALDELQASWDAFARRREGLLRRAWRSLRRRLGR